MDGLLKERSNLAQLIPKETKEAVEEQYHILLDIGPVKA
jgi:hypothetical protein